jgi:hypothetical protein
MLSRNAGCARCEELQDSTPIQKPVFTSAETITVTDPCHPLYGHECELVEIYHRQDGVTFCRIKVGELGRSDVPLTATNRGIPLPIPESLLSYQSLQQLLTTYQAIMEARDDKTARATSPEQEIQTDWSQASVAIHDGQATRAMYTDHQSDLPKAGQSADEGAGGG